MTGWKTGLLVAGLVAAAGPGAAGSPGRDGQVRVVQGPRTLELFTGGGRLGVSIRELEAPAAGAPAGAAGGVVVEAVTADSPAETAGMRQGDIIVEFDGERVRSVRQMTRLVQETPAGRTVEAVLLRDGQRTTVPVTPREGPQFSFDSLEGLGEFGRDIRARIAPRPPAPPSAPGGLPGRSSALGITAGTLTPQLAEYFGATEGVLVTSVSDGSAAAKAGLKAGDVITAVNGSSVAEPADVRRRVQSLDEGGEFRLSVMRDRKPVTVTGTVERVERRRTVRSTV